MTKTFKTFTAILFASVSCPVLAQEAPGTTALPDIDIDKLLCTDFPDMDVLIRGRCPRIDKKQIKLPPGQAVTKRRKLRRIVNVENGNAQRSGVLKRQLVECSARALPHRSNHIPAPLQELHHDCATEPTGCTDNHRGRSAVTP